MDVFEVTGTVLTVVRQTYRLLSSFFFFTRHYGILGGLLCTFDNQSIWSVQVRILRSNNDTDAMKFRRAVQDECSIIAVASTILAQIAITALSLDNLSETHWIARGCFVFSLVSSIIAVYYATKQYCHLGRCLNAEDVRAWIRSKNLTTEVKNPFGSRLEKPVEKAKQDLYKNFPCIASVLVMSAPNMLLDSSLNSFVIGLGVYLGCIWTRNLDEAAGSKSSEAVFITYIVGLTTCYWVFSLSNTVVADKGYVSEEKLVGENEYRQKAAELAARRSRERVRRNEERAIGDEEWTIGDEESSRADEHHSTAQSVSSHKMTSNTAAESIVSTNGLEESAQRQVQQDSTTQSMSIQEELAQVFQEAARLRNESAKVDKRLAQLLEKLGRGIEG